MLENGTIIIDEIAAENDVNNIRIGKEMLEEAIHTMNQIVVMAGEFEGNTGTVIVETARNILNEIQKLSDASDEASRRIIQTVENYKELDAQLKSQVEGAMNR